MLGDEKTEQFTVISRANGKVISEQAIHDPFIHNETIVRWNFLDAVKELFFTGKIEVVVETSVRGSEGAQRAIMMLDPLQLQLETADILDDRRRSRESASSVRGAKDAQNHMFFK